MRKRETQTYKQKIPDVTEREKRVEKRKDRSVFNLKIVRDGRGTRLRIWMGVHPTKKLWF